MLFRSVSQSRYKSHLQPVHRFHHLYLHTLLSNQHHRTLPHSLTNDTDSTGNLHTYLLPILCQPTTLHAHQQPTRLSLHLLNDQRQSANDNDHSGQHHPVLDPHPGTRLSADGATGPEPRYATGEDAGTSNRRVRPAYRDWETDRKSTRLNSSHEIPSRMPSSA